MFKCINLYEGRVENNCDENIGNFIHQDMLKITSCIEFGNVHRIYERPAQENDLTRPIGIIHRFSRLVMLLFHKWLHVRLNHKDACI